jgi:hypothetical protein
VILEAFLGDFRGKVLEVSLWDLLWKSHMRILCLFSW